MTSIVLGMFVVVSSSLIMLEKKVNWNVWLICLLYVPGCVTFAVILRTTDKDVWANEFECKLWFVKDYTNRFNNLSIDFFFLSLKQSSWPAW